MQFFSESKGQVKISVKTPRGSIGVKLSRVQIMELARALECCPGARQSIAHAIWHYNNPQQIAPCPDPEMYSWR